MYRFHVRLSGRSAGLSSTSRTTQPEYLTVIMQRTFSHLVKSVEVVVLATLLIVSLVARFLCSIRQKQATAGAVMRAGGGP